MYIIKVSIQLNTIIIGWPRILCTSLANISCSVTSSSSHDYTGKVLVHCLMGLSRSATSVLAFLMIKRAMSVKEAVQQVCQHRFIRPNEGFLLQLVQLGDKLKQDNQVLTQLFCLKTKDNFDRFSNLFGDYVPWMNPVPTLQRKLKV